MYIQVHSPKDTFTLEVMDYQNLTKDRSLGTTEFSAASLIKEGEDKKNAPWLPTGKVDRKEMLRSDGKKTVKGSVRPSSSSERILTACRSNMRSSSSRLCT